MNILDEKETISWLMKRGLADNDGKLSFSGYPSKSYVLLSADAGRKTKTAMTIASLYADSSESLLWINEFGIWPSCENWNLFNGFRYSLGEDAPLYQKPGHIFTMEDIETVDSLLAMVLYFFWGAIVVSNDKDFLVRISHDEYIDVYASDESTLSGITEKLSYLQNGD